MHVFHEYLGIRGITDGVKRGAGLIYDVFQQGNEYVDGFFLHDMDIYA